MRRLTVPGICLVGITSALCSPTVAGAAPGSQSFQQSHPVASALCERVAAGQASKRLESNKEAVSQACSELMSSYTSAQNAVSSAYTTYEQARQSAIGTRDSACAARLRAPHRNPGCAAARQSFRKTMAQLHETYRAAVTQFFTSVQSARLAFWNTIGGLRQA